MKRLAALLTSMLIALVGGVGVGIIGAPAWASAGISWITYWIVLPRSEKVFGITFWSVR